MNLTLPQLDDKCAMRIVPTGPHDLLRMSEMPFMFKQDTTDGTFLVHISTVERLMHRGWIKGASADAKQRIREYKQEIRTSFIGKDEDPPQSMIDQWMQIGRAHV